MLDALKSLGGNKGKAVDKQSAELELLVAAAREERNALSAMLSALTTRSATLMPLSKSLEQVAEKATSVTARLDDLATRVASLDARTKGLEEIDARIQALKESAEQTAQTTQKAIGPDGELQKHREAVQQLSAQALQTQASLETLKKERALFEELRGQLHVAHAEVKQSASDVGGLKTEIDQVHAMATTLAQDYAKIRDTSREAR